MSWGNQFRSIIAASALYSSFTFTSSFKNYVGAMINTSLVIEPEETQLETLQLPQHSRLLSLDAIRPSSQRENYLFEHQAPAYNSVPELRCRSHQERKSEWHRTRNSLKYRAVEKSNRDKHEKGYIGIPSFGFKI